MTITAVERRASIPKELRQKLSVYAGCKRCNSSNELHPTLAGFDFGIQVFTNYQKNGENLRAAIANVDYIEVGLSGVVNAVIPGVGLADVQTVAGVLRGSKTIAQAADQILPNVWGSVIAAAASTVYTSTKNGGDSAHWDMQHPTANK